MTTTPNTKGPSAPLLRVVERFCQSNDIPVTRFGRDAVRDPRLVSDMRAGREITAKREQRIRTYMDEWKA